MTLELPTLIISRRPRQLDSGWDNARSWLGGKPQLGAQPWPRSKAQQTPLYFLAQIDLAEVAREMGPRSSLITLPDGPLAFFVGREDDECAVVYVPRSALGKPTEPPADAPAALNPGSYPFPETFNDEASRVFARWPVDITAVDVEPVGESDPDERREKEDQALYEAFAQRFRVRPFNFSADEAYKKLGDVPRQIRWHSAQHYAACLRRALQALPGRIEKQRRDLETARAQVDRLRPSGITGVLSMFGLRANPPDPKLKMAEGYVARLEPSLANLEQSAADFERFVEGVSNWTAGKDPWQQMPPEAVEKLASNFERGKKDFRELTTFYAPHGFAELETETLLALATADNETYATMPEPVRTLINTEYLLPVRSCGWHQMFGRGVDIQSNAAEANEGNVMLLQLVYDDMMHWRFGDNGAFQFWIPPDDLVQANWAAVRVTFECH